MNRTVLIVGALLVAGAADASESWSGTWRCGVGKNATGELRTVDRDGDVEFQLQLWGEPPAHSSGLAEGHLAVRDGRAVFETTEFGGKCRIEFAFEPKRIAIEQKEGDWAACGFGHSIEAHGTFVRTSRKPPKFSRF
jgi:hypothetical protein